MLDNLRRRSSSPTNLLDIIARGAHALAHEAGAARRAVRSRASRFGAVPARRLRHGVGAVQRRLDHRRPRRAARRPRRLGATGSSCGRCAAGSPTSRWRCTSKSTSRRCRPRCSARSRRASNGHIPESAALVRRVVEQAIEACVAHGRVAPRRAGSRCAATPRRSAAWRWSRVLVVAARSRVPPQRAVGDAARVRGRRGRGRRIASRSSRATPRCRRAPTRPITAKLLGFDCGRRRR